MPDQRETLVRQMIAEGTSDEDILATLKVYDAQQPAQPKAEPRSLGGFASNVASSGGRFLRDTATGAAGLAKGIATMAGDVFAPDPVKVAEHGRAALGIAKNAPRILGSLVQGAKDRYGGMEQIKNTLYTDPVGVLADASTLLGGAGLAAKAGGAGKVARAATAASDLTNPMRAVGAIAEPLARGTARTIIRGTLRPPAAVREDFGGSKGVADAVLKNRVFSEASSQRKLNSSVAQADKLIADAEAAGVGGVPRRAVADAVMGEPAQTAQIRTRLGKTDQRPALMGEAKDILRNNPREIPLTEAQRLKREAQDLAFEAGTDNQSVLKAAEKAKASALREGIEQRVPGVKPVNQRSQELLGTQKAFAAAEDRPRALTNMLSALGGVGGFAGGGPAGAALLPLLIKAMDSPRAGALAGIGINSVGQAANAPDALRTALLTRLLGEDE